MMSIFRRALSVCFAFMLLVQLLPIIPAHANEAIVFGDAAVEQAIRTQLSLPSGPITEEDMKSISYLDLPTDANIKSLQGLEYAVNLYSLEVKYNQIEDLTPISHLTQLTELNLSNNRISDLSPLASLPELTKLIVQYNELKDISPLAGLPKLENLYINRNEISDLSPLVSIASLKYADVTANYIDVKAAMNQSAIASLEQRQVTLLGIEAQRKPPYIPKISWTKLFQDLTTDADYHPDVYSGFAYGNGIYVSSENYSSKDGIHWTSNPAKIYFKDVVFGKGRFVAVGFDIKDEGEDVTPIWTSTDGINWTKAAQLNAHAFIRYIAFSGTRFVVAGGHNPAGYIFSSEDGLKWTERKTGMATDLKGLEWGNNTFVALGYRDGKFLASKDGITWKKVSLPVKYVEFWDLSFGMGFNGNAFFATDNDETYLTSKDGVKWTTIAKDANGIVWGNFRKITDRYYAFGVKKINGEKVRFYRTSIDGVKWTDVKYTGKAEDFSLDEVVHDGKQYISYTFRAVYASADGANWKPIKKINRMPTIVSGSAVGDGKMVSVGGYTSSWGFFQMGATGKASYDSEDGKGPLNDVIWTGKQFLAVGGEGLMMTSKDGIKWTETASPTKESIYRIIQAKDTYYITGSNGLIMSSKDLKTWKKQKTNTTLPINSIAWNGKTFVAVGLQTLGWAIGGSIALTSDNGTDWKPVTINLKTSGVSSTAFALSDVAWGNGTFVITARQIYNLDLPYTVFVSTDGKKWTKVGTKYETTEERDWSQSFYGVRYTGDQFVAVGNNGSVYISKDGKEWGREEIPDSEQLFTAQYFNGKLYVVSAFTGQVYVGEFKK